MTMFLLTSTAVMDALIAQHQAGHEVKVLLNPNASSSSSSNQHAFDTLHGAGVDVKFAPAHFTFTHEKCVIIDGTEAWIMTMNATQSSPTANREYLAVDTNTADVDEADAIFAADFAAHNAPVAPHLVVSPGARTKLVALIGTAHHTLDLEGEELSDTPIVNALVARAAAGVQVRVVLASGTASPAQTTAVHTLSSHGVDVVTLDNPYMHAKVIDVDGTSAYVGSMNFTANSLDNNRELGVIFSGATELHKITTTIAADFAAGTP
jgi:phosphatidylserine/phosphatidylglycerophosphate/cardiolipin synthase-like enzyme